MTKKFEVGDHVRWNSEAGYVTGHVVKIHTDNFDVNGYTHHCTEENPQYEIKSDKTDHHAFHRGSSMKRIK